MRQLFVLRGLYRSLHGTRCHVSIKHTTVGKHTTLLGTTRILRLASNQHRSPLSNGNGTEEGTKGSVLQYKVPRTMGCTQSVDRSKCYEPSDTLLVAQLLDMKLRMACDSKRPPQSGSGAPYDMKRSALMSASSGFGGHTPTVSSMSIDDCVEPSLMPSNAAASEEGRRVKPPPLVSSHLSVTSPPPPPPHANLPDIPIGAVDDDVTVVSIDGVSPR